MSLSKAAVVLAAGKGKRMKSDLPKVLHQINNKSLIRHVMETMAEFSFDKLVVVVGHKGEMVIDELADFKADFVWQKEQLGTGHAVMMAEDHFKAFNGIVLVAAGDVPFLAAETITRLLKTHMDNKASATCLSVDFDNPEGYGRIIRDRDSDVLLDIIEEKDAGEDIKRIKEVNSGTFCFNCPDLFGVLHNLKNDNAQGEYYLTDTIKILQSKGNKCAVFKTSNPLEVAGVNSFKQLKQLEDALNQKNH